MGRVQRDPRGPRTAWPAWAAYCVAHVRQSELLQPSILVNVSNCFVVVRVAAGRITWVYLITRRRGGLLLQAFR